MKQSYNDLVRRAQFFSLTCDIKDENGVVHHFHHGHEYVEIGGMKWATMNIGAEKPTDCGLYFQWGSPKGYFAKQVRKGVKRFDWDDYGLMPKYNVYDGKTTLDAEDDGVAVNWGGKWRMPTTDELRTLGDSTNTTWTNNYRGTRVKGIVCVAKDGSGVELFFPAAGYCYGGSRDGVGSSGHYWSSSLNSSCSHNAYTLLFISGYVNWHNYDSRCCGFSLRGIIDE